IIDLYSAIDESKTKSLSPSTCKPFLQCIELAGPKGEVVRVKALFDDGAMVGAMCSTVFHKVKHRLGGWQPSTRKLRMANGTVIRSKAIWHGEITIGQVQAKGHFEVFNSGGGWQFLFGKPLLQAFKAVHEYETDVVHISNASVTNTLRNRSRATAATVEDQNKPKGIRLTENVKLRRMKMGGLAQPPSR
ncbi:hypothetical protein BV22DRAFT_987923, partial [Leucogyrophana mollusca]